MLFHNKNAREQKTCFSIIVRKCHQDRSFFYISILSRIDGNSMFLWTLGWNCWKSLAHYGHWEILFQNWGMKFDFICFSFILFLKLQWCAIDNHQDPIYVVNLHFSTHLERCEKWYYAIFKLCTNSILVISYAQIDMALGFQMSYFSSL